MKFWYYFIPFLVLLVFTVYYEAKTVGLLKRDYKELYKEYGNPLPLFITNLHFSFTGELILGGYYKSVIKFEDHYYPNKLRICYFLQWAWALAALIVYILN